MNLNIYSLPYDSTRPRWRMGNGPDHFLHNGLVGLLQSRGHTITTLQIDPPAPAPSEIKTTFELYRSLAEEIHKSSRASGLSLVLSGNCGAAIGTLSGWGKDPLGIIWFDAHGDFNTPETTLSGYLDGMSLAIACGLCWSSLARSIPGFFPVRGENVLHVGGSDLDVDEVKLMDQSGVQRISTSMIHFNGLAVLLTPALSVLSTRVKDIYLHLDLDVLDPVKTPANHFPAKDGLAVETVIQAIHLIRQHFDIRAVGVASYDPDYDPTGSTLRAGIELIRAAIED